MARHNAWRQVRSQGSAAVHRVAEHAYPLLQQTAAATTAWLLARYALDRTDPFFAPISAFVALNRPLGERGLNALQLLQGVIVGILVGELTILVMGDGAPAMAVAILVAGSIARAVGGAPVTISQAAIGAILTVSVGGDEVGPDRVVNALIGAGVALVFSQLLFSPEPVELLRRAERRVLTIMADALALTAQSLEDQDPEPAEQATRRLRDLPGPIADLERLREASDGVARRSLLWRSRRKLVVTERENAGHLDLLGASCLSVARAAHALPEGHGKQLAPSIRQLADVLGAVRVDLGNRATRQRAADGALAVSRRVGEHDLAAATMPAVVAVRAAATELIVFAGADIGDAVEAVRAGILDQRIPQPPPTSGGIGRWWRDHQAAPTNLLQRLTRRRRAR